MAERTFFLHFANQEAVVLGDVRSELESMATALVERSPGTTALEVFRQLGDRRVALFRDHSEQVSIRCQVESDNPEVHARAVVLREEGERTRLRQVFAEDLALPADHPNVELLLAAFTGTSGRLDALFERSADDDAARAALDAALDALTAAAHALAAGSERHRRTGGTGPP